MTRVPRHCRQFGAVVMACVMLSTNFLMLPELHVRPSGGESTLDLRILEEEAEVSSARQDNIRLLQLARSYKYQPLASQQPPRRQPPLNQSNTIFAPLLRRGPPAVRGPPTPVL